ncbi:MAG: HlyD family efflux transporter periplasmic adaptor subunit [Lachnospiraceae bacterium]|nr:HlyD family efflux transporter periplasmic adaptor subunit [Lachnospiraceae bacterium]
MKKYIVLLCLSLTAVLSVFAVGYNCVENINYISAISLSESTAVESLVYSGAVEYMNSSHCYAYGTGVVQSLLVNDGDYVTDGTPVMTVYQTEDEISKSDIMSALTDNSYDELYNMISDKASVVVYSAEGDGIISSLNMDEGSIFQKGQTLFKVSPENSYQVQLNISERDISKIKLGQSVQVYCKAVKKKLKGTVISIGSSAKQSSTTAGKETTVSVVVSVDDECEELKCGYSAVCTIIVSQKENALLIPYSSLGADENGDEFVYIYSDGKIEPHYVMCGKEYSNGQEIKAGLSPNDIIVSTFSDVKDVRNSVVNEVKPYER